VIDEHHDAIRREQPRYTRGDGLEQFILNRRGQIIQGVGDHDQIETGIEVGAQRHHIALAHFHVLQRASPFGSVADGDG